MKKLSTLECFICFSPFSDGQENGDKGQGFQSAVNSYVSPALGVFVQQTEPGPVIIFMPSGFVLNPDLDTTTTEGLELSHLSRPDLVHQPSGPLLSC